MKNILIIGAGQLGSRHLQSLANLTGAYSIYVVDSNENSLKIAQQRYGEVNKAAQHSLSYLLNINELPNDKEIDVCIIATNSNVRATVTEQLINHIKVKTIIFEKVLFQNIEEYDRIQNILINNNIKAWVNCPRRLYPIYKELKKYFNHDEKISFQLNGGDWGLGCNAIHFIDLFSFLNSNNEFEFYTDFLDDVLIDSKRAGYKEFTGTLIGKQKNGSEIILNSSVDSSAPHTISIQSKNLKMFINEPKGIMVKAYSGNNWENEIENFKPLYQSQLTSLIVEEIISNNTCGLTSFEDSSIIHKRLIKSFISYIEIKTGQLLENCPIT